MSKLHRTQISGLIALSVCISIGGTTQAGEGPTPAPSNWSTFADKHWQRTSQAATESAEATDTREGTRGSCELAGMVHVDGQMVAGRTFGPDFTEVNNLQDEACTSWNTSGSVKRCTHFNSEALQEKLAKLKRKPMNFCIDRFEFPNVKGQNPVIMMTFPEAAALCKTRGERLCTDEEWTFACEGEQAKPYPYGYDRSAESCNADNPEYVNFGQALVKLTAQYQREAISCHQSGTPVNAAIDRMVAQLRVLATKRGMAVQEELTRKLLRHRSGPEAAQILEALWAGEPSGSRPGCRSPFGVYDMTGNVDEWTTNRISGASFKGAQKGGYWGPVRARCRSATVAHNEEHMFYQQGTRCCSDH